MNLRHFFPNGSSNFFHLNNSVSAAQPQQDKAKPLGETVPGKTKSLRRIGVCFTLFRRRLLDDDNACAAIKDLLDGLRHAGLLPDDNPGCIALTTQQEQVMSKEAERVEIAITFPN